ncbi:hypothetical protein [Thermoflavimicrobium dichotomicum]|uniref:Uncharacterized protein n=1 Tax=Thermoflavimicrobium dichotomicum TaxID=46223 RepID=A0A1I3VI05_9BACL|nr:hypothetical protein [Thermoflavimicrobium dichotomicum]SFJ94623.1 hypothetical protein SAMN05421852_1522 [Thermoflavimicrobium dichotomicum]
MLNLYYIYRPATREYLQYFDQSGPHTVWGHLLFAYPFISHKKAEKVAKEISRADRITTQVITIKEVGRNTIECAVEV